MVILCPHCKREIDVDHSGNTICHICKHVFDAFIFSPVNKEVVVAAAAAMSIEGKKDAKCYMHPENRADHVCERCGSFICPVCLVEIEKKNLCPKCFDRMEDEGTLKTTKTIFFDWGR
ncbi:MAG: hypothetical protein KAI72_05780, partial [Candidatus Pacebacteria bacterium]|nr:hypothetical protein [Candidatus Paceibacterota bacterium]